MKYKSINYWFNNTQGLWMAQVGYEIVASAKTESALKSKITNYLKVNE